VPYNNLIRIGPIFVRRSDFERVINAAGLNNIPIAHWPITFIVTRSENHEYLSKLYIRFNHKIIDSIENIKTSVIVDGSNDFIVRLPIITPALWPELEGESRVTLPNGSTVSVTRDSVWTRKSAHIKIGNEHIKVSGNNLMEVYANILRAVMLQLI